MPLYDFYCGGCLSAATLFRHIETRNRATSCETCGETLQRILSAPSVRTDIAPYQSPGTGKWITSRSEQREDLRRSGAFLYEPGVKKDIERNRLHVQEKAFTPISAAVDETVRNLVAAGKLEN